MIKMRTVIISALLFLSGIGTVHAASAKIQCIEFDRVALQLALAQNNMRPPLDLENIQSSLGTQNAETNITITTDYFWNRGGRALIVRVKGDNISETILKGNDDGSTASKTMEQLHTKLKSATSVWSIKEIQSQLGLPSNTSSKKSLSYAWSCGSGSLKVTTNENNDIIAADINYNASANAIEARIGPSHPTWDIKTDSLGQSHRAWQRSYTN